MYSFEAWQVVNTIVSRDGFYFVFFISTALALGFLFISALLELFDDYKFLLLTTIVVWLSVVGYSYHVSSTTGEIITPKNEVVIGTFVGFQPEAFNVQSGKYTRTVRETYVVYKLPDESQVLMRANAGASYPEKAILYKK